MQPGFVVFKAQQFPHLARPKAETHATSPFALSNELIKAVNMPKMKSNSGAKKRFTTTGTGRIRRKKAFASHILTKKSPKRKRNLRGVTLVDPVDEPRMRKLMNG